MQILHHFIGLPHWLSGKEFAMQETWVQSLGAGHGNPLQYSCLENPMDRGTWWATAHRVAKLDTTKAGIFPTQGSNPVFTS